MNQVNILREVTLQGSNRALSYLHGILDDARQYRARKRAKAEMEQEDIKRGSQRFLISIVVLGIFMCQKL